MHHCSTVEERVQWVSQLLVPEPPHGLVSQLSRSHEVSRQTLYRWKEKGVRALQAALEIRPAAAPKQKRAVHEQVLTLLIEAYASYRNIQTCLLKMCGVKLSVGSMPGSCKKLGNGRSSG
jgi:hypothetical protein